MHHVQLNDTIYHKACIHLIKLINPLGPIADISVMRLSASWWHFRQCPWDLGSAWAESVGQGEVGGCTWRVQTAWLTLSLGSALETSWLALGGPLLFSYAWTGWDNCPLILRGAHFRQGSFFPSLGDWLPADSHDYFKLINGWVWFESQMCRGWLQEHLCEVWGLKTWQNCGDVECMYRQKIIHLVMG